MHCPSCGFENPEGMNFCGRCGTKLTPRCPQCGFENPPGFAFCGKCGRPVHETARVSTLEADVPVPPPPAQDPRRLDLQSDSTRHLYVALTPRLPLPGRRFRHRTRRRAVSSRAVTYLV
jgi:hypothetical protein